MVRRSFVLFLGRGEEEGEAGCVYRLLIPSVSHLPFHILGDLFARSAAYLASVALDFCWSYDALLL